MVSFAADEHDFSMAAGPMSATEPVASIEEEGSAQTPGKAPT